MVDPQNRFQYWKGLILDDLGPQIKENRKKCVLNKMQSYWNAKNDRKIFLHNQVRTAPGGT